LWRNTSQTEGRTNNNEPSSPSLISSRRSSFVLRSDRAASAPVYTTTRFSRQDRAPARRLAGLEVLTTSGRREPGRLREALSRSHRSAAGLARPVTLKPFLSGLMFADRRPMCWKPHTPTLLSLFIYLIRNVCFSSANGGCTLFNFCP
jgi:hypothetical protein